jgi:radical SAM superfamily enzyme YgiQ (UPF0313 family)
MRVLLASAVTPTIPMGLFAIADALERAGHAPRIVHLALERARDPGFSLGSLAAREEAALVGISLHWAHQAPASIEAAAEVKLARPGAFVVAGGLTASAHAAEVLALAPAIDAVVRGEGEGPLVALAEALARGERDLSSVPNLVWRGGARPPPATDRDASALSSEAAAPAGGREASPRSPPPRPRGRKTKTLPLAANAAPAAPGIVENPIRYVATPASLEGLRYARHDLLRLRADYLALDLFPGRLSPPVFLLCTGRGCSVNCTACGGGRESHMDLSGRDRALFRPIDAVVEDLRAALAHGCRSFYVCNDPKPNGPYFFELFERLAAEGLAARLELGFGCWGLPSRAFLEAARRTFPRVFLEISPETASEPLRRRIRGFFYANADLEERLREAEALGCEVELYFGFPAAGEGEEDLRATRVYANRLALRHGERVGANVLALSTDPASPQVKDPEGYDLELRARGLSGILRALEEDRALYPPAGRPPWFQNYLHHRPRRLPPRALALAGLAAASGAALRARRPRLLAGAVRACGGEEGFERLLEGALGPVLDALEAERGREGRLMVDDAEAARRGVAALCGALEESFGARLPGLADLARVAAARERLLSRLAEGRRGGEAGPPGSGRRDAAGPSLPPAWFRAAVPAAPPEASGIGRAAWSALRGVGPPPPGPGHEAPLARPTERADLRRLPPSDADPRVGGPLDLEGPAAPTAPVRLLLTVDPLGREWGLEASPEAERTIALSDGRRSRWEVVAVLAAEGIPDGDAWIDELTTYGAIEPARLPRGESMLQ